MVGRRDLDPALRGNLKVDTLTSQDRRPAEATQSPGILPLVRARGRHAEIGFQVGSDRAHQVRRMVETYRRLFREESEELGVADWADAIGIARLYLPFVERALPQYADEMRGLAEGGVSFDGILVLNSIRSITADRLHLGCASLAASSAASAEWFRSDAHNEIGIPRTRATSFWFRPSQGELRLWR
jgi:hypothetical protein